MLSLSLSLSQKKKTKKNKKQKTKTQKKNKLIAVVEAQFEGLFTRYVCDCNLFIAIRGLFGI